MEKIFCHKKMLSTSVVSMVIPKDKDAFTSKLIVLMMA